MSSKEFMSSQAVYPEEMQIMSSHYNQTMHIPEARSSASLNYNQNMNLRGYQSPPTVDQM